MTIFDAVKEEDLHIIVRFDAETYLPHIVRSFEDHAILEDDTISTIRVIPNFTPNFFEGLSLDQTDTKPSPPLKVQGYSHAEIGEYWTATFWGGEYVGTYENLSVVLPAMDLPDFYKLLFEDNSTLEQLVLEFEDSLIVYDAPLHQTDLVIRWVNEIIGKPITHSWVRNSLFD